MTDEKGIKTIGKVVSLPLWEGKQRDFSTLLERIISEGKRLLDTETKSADAVECSVAAMTFKGKPIGVPVGVIKDFSQDDIEAWTHLSQLLSEKFAGIPCFIENDGNAAALSISRKTGLRNIIILRFGTNSCIGYIDKFGKIPLGPNEFSKLRLDLTDDHPDPYYQGRTSSYLSFRGICHIAEKLSVLTSEQPENNSVPEQIRDMLGSSLATERSSAEKVYKELGRYATSFILEMAMRFAVQNVIFVGSIISGEPKDLIMSSANHYLRSTLHRPGIRLLASSAEIDRLSGAGFAFYSTC
ncbi:MAG: acetate and sugar kinases/Hsc70/actin family protein [bacterium]